MAPAAKAVTTKNYLAPLRTMELDETPIGQRRNLKFYPVTKGEGKPTSHHLESEKLHFYTYHPKSLKPIKDVTDTSLVKPLQEILPIN